MGKQKLKKQMAGFLAVCMLMGTTSGYGLKVSAEEQDTAMVSSVWGVGEFEELEIADTQPEGKQLMVKYIQNGTYTLKENENNALMINNATVYAGQDYSKDLLFRLSGDSTLAFKNVDVCSSGTFFPSYNGYLNANDLFNFYNSGVYEEGPGRSIKYDYIVTDNFRYEGFLDANVIEVEEGKKFTAGAFEEEGTTAGSLINVWDLDIKGEVYMEKAENGDKPTGINILDNGTLTVDQGAKLTAGEGAELHILPGAKVIGLPLYDVNVEGEDVEFILPYDHGEEVFRYVNDKWKRMRFAENPVGSKQFQLDWTRFWDEDNQGKDDISISGQIMPDPMPADLTNFKIEPGQRFTFEPGQEIVFKLIPPPERQGCEPVVEVNFENGETLSTRDPEHKIEVKDYTFSITPKDETGFNIFIAWSDYDAVRYGEDEFLMNGASHGGQIKTSVQPKQEVIDPADTDLSRMVFKKEVLKDGKLRLEFVPNEGCELALVMLRADNDWKSYYPGEIPVVDDNVIRLPMTQENGFTFEDGKWYYTVSKITEFNDISVEPIFVDTNYQKGFPEGIFVRKNGFKVKYKVGDDAEFTEWKEDELPKDKFENADSVTLKVTESKDHKVNHIRIRYDNNGEVIERIPLPENGIYTITKDGDDWKGYDIEICEYDSILDYQYRIDKIGNGPDVTIEGDEFTVDDKVSTFKPGDEISFKVKGLYHGVYVFPNDSEPKELKAKDGVYTYKPDNRGFFIHVYVTADDRDYEMTQPDYSKLEYYVEYMTEWQDHASGEVIYEADVEPVMVKRDSIGRTKLTMKKEAKKLNLFIIPDSRSDYKVEYMGKDVTEQVKKNFGIFSWNLTGEGQFYVPKITFIYAEKKVSDVFTDVEEKEWYNNAVQFVFDNAIMNGTSDTTFAPRMVLTREQFVTVLYNMENRPSVADAENFKDVVKGQYYEKPILWAKSNQITSGVSETEFGVGNKIPRQQLVTLLYNYAKVKGYDLTVRDDAISAFPDVTDVAKWAETSMKWAVTNGVIGGKQGTDGKKILDPNGEATRAECAQMIKNLKEKFEIQKQ